jgi:hypothetical protein
MDDDEEINDFTTRTGICLLLLLLQAPVQSSYTIIESPVYIPLQKHESCHLIAEPIRNIHLSVIKVFANLKLKYHLFKIILSHLIATTIT